MKSHSRRDSDELLTEEERKFLEAINQSRKETSAPEGVRVDVRSVAAKSAALYLAASEGSEPLPKNVRDILETYGTGFNNALLEFFDVEPKKEFNRDFLFSIIPTVIILVMGGVYLYLQRESGPVHLQAPYLIAGLGILIAIPLGFIFRHWSGTGNFPFKFLSTSSGALVGGMVVASIAVSLGGYGVNQKAASVKEKTEDMERHIAAVAFWAVGNKEENLESRVENNLAHLTTRATVQVKSESPKEVTVIANPEGVNEKIVAKINPNQAEIFYTDSKQPSYRILVGTISDFSDNKIELKSEAPDSGDQNVRLVVNREGFKNNRTNIVLSDNGNNLTSTNLVGSKVKVWYVPSTNTTLKMALTNNAAGSNQIYNNIVTVTSDAPGTATSANQGGQPPE